MPGLHCNAKASTLSLHSNWRPNHFFIFPVPLGANEADQPMDPVYICCRQQLLHCIISVILLDGLPIYFLGDRLRNIPWTTATRISAGWKLLRTYRFYICIFLANAVLHDQLPSCSVTKALGDICKYSKTTLCPNSYPSPIDLRLKVLSSELLHMG